MHVHVYLPVDVARKRRGEAVLVGHRLASAIVVVQAYQVVPGDLGGMEVVGGLNREGKGPTLVYNGSVDRLVAKEDGNSYTLVTFDPPNLRNLEYFSVDAILLQSTGQRVSQKVHVEGLGSRVTSDVFGEEVLEKINFCQSDRALLNKLNKQAWRLPSKPAYWFPSWAARLLCFVVSCILSVLIWFIGGLNSDFFNGSLVEKSAFFKQLDLRLRQIAYFPAQFLFYRNSAILTDPKSDWPRLLQLPSYNEKYNINNSNYINLYNSIWLIVNDVLIGVTMYRLFTREQEPILAILNEKVLNDWALQYLGSLIQWVSAEHPYGFKLNDELGQFMGSMFMWTLNAWSAILQITIKYASAEPVFGAIKTIFKCICFMGISFSLAALMDYITVVTLHIHFFTVVTTKVYHRQVEALKSLWQLFRGKKYNVLRQRIDNLDEEQFRVDRLLLGTLLFTILVYLLPTTFAFYLLFYVAKAIILTAEKWTNKLLVVLNMYPIFVLLLKLKNSRRLQGGIVFESRGGVQSTNWLHMSNKALTQDEIFVNFWHVFKNEGKVERLFLNFAQGRHIRVRDTISMKFHYLRLPARYEMLKALWKEAI
ncbi:hypothetical protein FT663_03959 [Candidozyma haemuli var. vulneris]|nr:hypothetical protein FT662_04013 [[Candida] haemuloni var. vulneris]KAF3988603.1 hypothetical protein FT663_03959 [[Candida] haemuloni var. vulneris]